MMIVDRNADDTDEIISFFDWPFIDDVIFFLIFMYETYLDLSIKEL